MVIFSLPFKCCPLQAQHCIFLIVRSVIQKINLGGCSVKLFTAVNKLEFLPLSLTSTLTGSAKANGKKLKTCFGRVFNYKLGCFDYVHELFYMDVCPHLQLKTRPSGLYYKYFTMVIYDHNDIGLYYKTRDDRN